MSCRLTLHICCSFNPASSALVKAQCCLARTTSRFCKHVASFAGEPFTCMSYSAGRSSSYHPKDPWSPAWPCWCCPWDAGSVHAGCPWFGLSGGAVVPTESRSRCCLSSSKKTTCSILCAAWFFLPDTLGAVCYSTGGTALNWTESVSIIVLFIESLILWKTC